MKNDRTVSVEEVVKQLSYDPSTGELRWKIGKCGVRPGVIAGSVSKSGYRKIKLNGVEHCAHRLAWVFIHGRFPDGFIDHINLDKDDNRPGNLREATRNQNNANRRPTCASGKKGVSLHKGTGKWMAQIKVNGKRLYLGLHESKDVAHEAYAKAAIEHFGEFARTE